MCLIQITLHKSNQCGANKTDERGTNRKRNKQLNLIEWDLF